MIGNGDDRHGRSNATGDVPKPSLLLLRTVCAVYWSMLSALLLLPGSLLEAHRVAEGLKGVGVHLVAFAVLGFLIGVSRWPLRRAWLVVLLGGYAIAVEAVQWLVPSRSVELPDFVENVVGLAAGFAIWHLAQAHTSRAG